MENTCSWENEDGWRLLQKWFQLSCEISVAAGGLLSDRRFVIKSGLITHLDPSLIRIRGDGQEYELALSEIPHFEDVWSGEIAAENPLVKSRFPETVKVSVWPEEWRFTGPIEIEGL